MTSKSKNPPEKRDYKKEYARDQKKRIKYRTELNKVNRQLQKEGKATKGDGKDVSHVSDVRKGASPASKTKLEDAKTNRDWRKGKKGYDRGRKG
jgi:hypothetical protein